jgi:hypothetical protein
MCPSKWFATAALLILAGCKNRGVELDQSAWLCTRIGQYDEDTLMVAGTAAVATTERKTGCVQWSRIEAK